MIGRLLVGVGNGLFGAEGVAIKGSVPYGVALCHIKDVEQAAVGDDAWAADLSPVRAVSCLVRWRPVLAVVSLQDRGTAALVVGRKYYVFLIQAGRDTPFGSDAVR